MVELLEWPSSGKLTIESEVGKGTKVTVSLPYRVPAQPPQDDLQTEAA